MGIGRIIKREWEGWHRIGWNIQMLFGAKPTNIGIWHACMVFEPCLVLSCFLSIYPLYTHTSLHSCRIML